MRRLSSIASLLTLTVAASCLDLNPNVTACTITVAPASITMSVNQTSAIVGTAFDCKGNSIAKKTITFSTANPAVATVTISGQVIGVGLGQTTVSAVADGKSATVAVTVTREAIASVTVNPPIATLRRSNKRQLSAVARNAQSLQIADVVFRWNSSNSSIVSVNSTGEITAVAAGTATITADVNNIAGGATIVVTELPIGACSLSPNIFKVTTGQPVQPTLALLDTASAPLTSLGRPIAWTSDNESVAIVTSGSGAVSTRRAGVAIITAASVEYPTITCKATVEVVDPRIARVVITPLSGLISLRIGVPRSLGVALLDSVNGTIPPGRAVTWSTNTPTVATVSQVGIVTGLALGNARIIATSEGVADTVVFAVTKIPVGSVTIAPLQVVLQEGQKVQLTPTVTDSAGTIVIDRVVDWLTNDPSRATVSATGLVTAIAAGNVFIQATAENRVGQASIIIQQVPADSIAVTNATLTVKVGTINQTAFSYTVLDVNKNILRNRTVAISNTAPGVLQATQQTATGQINVLGVATGTAVLTLQTLNANGQAEGKATTVTVNVVP